MTRFIAALTFSLVSPFAALAQQFVNRDFETGDISGWTMGLTSGGANTIQQVIAFDIDGPGVLGSSLSAQFSAGRATGVSTGEHGVTLMQQLNLAAGVQYTFEFDWAATRPAGQGANSQGGIFALMVDTTEITRQAAGSTSGAAPKYGHVSGLFTPPADGNYMVGVWILRPFTIPANLFQNVDNFNVIGPPVPEPAGLSLLALAGLIVLRRRHK